MTIRHFLPIVFVVASYTFASAQPLSLHILSPNGGETLRGGAKTTITWSGLYNALGDSVRLELSTDGGVTWTKIAEPVAGDGYEWTVPHLSSFACRIRATQVAGDRRVGSRVRTFSSDTLIGDVHVVFSRDGSLIGKVAGGNLHVWRTATGELVRAIESDGGIMGLPSFTPDNARVVVAIYKSGNSRSEIWDLASGTKVFTLYPSGNPEVPAGIENEIWWTEYSPDGSRIAMASKFSLSLWNAATGTIIDSVPEPEEVRISYSGDGRYLFTGFSNLKVRDPSTLAVIKTIKRGYRIDDISHDGKFLLIGAAGLTGKDSIFLIDVDKGTSTTLWYWPDHTGPVFSGFSRDLSRVMLGRMFDDEMLTYDRGRSHLFATMEPGAVRAARFHPEGEYVAIVTESPRKFELWSVDPFDISDANFTIESSRRVLPTVTLASVKVGSELDTTLAMYVRNTESSPMTVREIAVASGHTGDFTVLDAGGFSLAPSEGRDIRVRFRPVDRGDRSAWLEVRTTVDTIVGEIRGVGLKGKLIKVPERIDFGDVKLNRPRDLWTHTFKNAGTAPLRIDSLNIAGVHRSLYSIVDAPPLPFTIQPGDTHALTLGCSLSVADRFSSAVLIYDDEYGEEHQIPLASNGVYQLGVDDNAAITGRSGLLRHIAPNPASTEVRVGCMGDAGENLAIELVDLMGDVVHSERYRCLESGLNEVKIDVQRVPSGTYLVRVMSNGKSDARLVVFQR